MIAELLQRSDAPAAVIYIPTPPSVNGLYCNRPGEGRTKGARYRQWLHDAGWRVKLQRPPHFTEPVAILVEAGLPRNRDLDNALKGTLDLLVEMAVLKDDNLVDDLRIVRRGVRGDEAIVSIWRLGDGAE